MTFEDAARACGIIAILRGVKPSEVLDIGNVLHAAGFGIGSNIYKPGLSADDVGRNAAAFVAAWNTLKRSG